MNWTSAGFKIQATRKQKVSQQLKYKHRDDSNSPVLNICKQVNLWTSHWFSLFIAFTQHNIKQAHALTVRLCEAMRSKKQRLVHKFTCLHTFNTGLGSNNRNSSTSKTTQQRHEKSPKCATFIFFFCINNKRKIGKVYKQISFCFFLLFFLVKRIKTNKTVLFYLFLFLIFWLSASLYYSLFVSFSFLHFTFIH